MQRERQEETEHDDVMEENAGPLLINKLEVQRQTVMALQFVITDKIILKGIFLVFPM